MPAEEELSPEEKLLRVIQDSPPDVVGKKSGQKGEAIDRIDKIDTIDKADTIDKTDATDKIDKADATDKVESVKHKGRPASLLGLRKTDASENDYSPAAPVGTRRSPVTLPKSKLVHGTTIHIVNRVLGAAVGLLAAGLVWELFAARPSMPESPGGGVSTQHREIVPLEPEAVYVDAISKRNIWGLDDAPQTPNGTVIKLVPGDADFARISDYVSKHVKLSGVSRSADTADSFAVIVDQRTRSMRYPGIGDALPFKVDNGAEVSLVVDEILEDRVILLFEGKEGTKTLILQGGGKGQ